MLVEGGNCWGLVREAPRELYPGVFVYRFSVELSGGVGGPEKAGDGCVVI